MLNISIPRTGSLNMTRYKRTYKLGTRDTEHPQSINVQRMAYQALARTQYALGVAGYSYAYVEYP